MAASVHGDRGRRDRRGDGTPVTSSFNTSGDRPNAEVRAITSLLPRAVQDRYSGSGPASSAHLICGLHPALAEHTLQRVLDAHGGLAGLLVHLQAWEEGE